MGWKYTAEITRKEAISLIHTHLDGLSNEELSDVMGSMFGDTIERPYHGANFSVYNDGDLRFDEFGNLKDECK
jgi:hypothetical protein